MNPIEMTAPEATYRQHPGTLHTALSEFEAVLLSLPAAYYYTLNESGGRIWQALHEGATAMQVASMLEGEYEIEPAQALATARAFLAELLREGLIQEESTDLVSGDCSG